MIVPDSMMENPKTIHMIGIDLAGKVMLITGGLGATAEPRFWG